MSTTEQPVISLTLTKPARLSDVTKWAAAADLLGFPTSSRVALTISGSLEVAAYLPQLTTALDGDA